MMLSRLRRANQPVIVALGHRAEGNGQHVDVLMVCKMTPEHAVELEDGNGRRYPVTLPSNLFDSKDHQVVYGIQLEAR